MSLSKINRYVLADTGFWLGLSDPHDDKAATSRELLVCLERFRVVMPWPLLYEVLRTHVVRRRSVLQRLERALQATGLERLDDGPYRQRALEATFDSALRRNWPISLVDMVCRLVVEDRSVRIDAMVTYNPRDFADVCRRRQVPLISHPTEMRGFSE